MLVGLCFFSHLNYSFSKETESYRNLYFLLHFWHFSYSWPQCSRESIQFTGQHHQNRWSSLQSETKTTIGTDSSVSLILNASILSLFSFLFSLIATRLGSHILEEKYCELDTSGLPFLSSLVILPYGFLCKLLFNVFISSKLLDRKRINRSALCHYLSNSLAIYQLGIYFY